METQPFDPAAYLDNKEAITANLAGARALYGAAEPPPKQPLITGNPGSLRRPPRASAATPEPPRPGVGCVKLSPEFQFLALARGAPGQA